MNIGFVSWRFESLGIQYLSAYLKEKGHKTTLYFDPSLFYDDHFFFSKKLHRIFDIKNKLVKRIVDANPDLLCFSVLAGNYWWACDIASEVKKYSNIPIIFGGIHPTAVPEVVIKKDFVDYVCVGEGEEALAELVSTLENKKLPYGISNIWFKDNEKIINNPVRPLIPNLDVLPLPDKDLFYQECPHTVNGVYVTMVSRGCYFTCTYCCNDMLRRIYPEGKGRVRIRSVELVIKELKIAKEKYRPKWNFFNDDIFPCKPSWLEEFCLQYKKEIGLPFGINSHVKMINPLYVSLLSQAGCSSIDIGVQSCNAQVREEMLNRHMDNDKIEDVIKLIQSHNIYVYIDLMLGLSRETDDYANQTIANLQKWKPDGIATLFLSYFPGTTMTKNEFKKGHISEEKMNELRDPINGSLSLVVGGNVPSKDLICNAAFYQLALYMPKEFLFFLRKNNILKVLPQRFILRFFAHTYGFFRRFIIYFFKHRKRCLRFSLRKETRFYITYLLRWAKGKIKK